MLPISLDIVSQLTSDVSILSSTAVIIGALFVAVQLRQNNKLIGAAAEQAKAAAVQAQLTTDQMKQNNELANMDMIMRLYEFANTAEFQSAWLTVLHSNISNKGDFVNLSKADQVSFFQVAALFESLGVLVDKGFVKPEIIEDMFQTELAWKMTKPFIMGSRSHFGEEGYVFFEKLYNTLTGGSKNQTG